jgi:hypothetical protein
VLRHVQRAAAEGDEAAGPAPAKTKFGFSLGLSDFAWSQSYDSELQRQRCKFLQRHG